MLKYASQRIAGIVPQLLLVAVVSFMLLEFAPGDPAVILAGENASPEDVLRIRHIYHLDRPLIARLWLYIWNAARGQLGSSLFNSQSVVRIVLNSATVTLSLVVVAVVIAVLIGMLGGTIAALWRGKLIDRLISAVAGLGLAVPSFVLSLFLIKWFTLDRSWFPAGGYKGLANGPFTWLKHLLLPALSLAVFPAAELARQMRTAVSNVLARDYIDTATAKGMRRRTILFKHVLKNAAIPVVTVIGVQIGRLIGGAVIIELNFNLPGLGSLIINSVGKHDVPVIQGLVLLTAVGVILVNFVVDLSYGYFNPKLRR